MRLKRIKLAGFKSFVDPTSIPFPDDMTAIVGPNGCGKSNVIDAVRWVLGESSAKNLRGDAMTDVIFNGSSARKPVSQCSVELVFDNSSGRIQGEYANYNELSVKRVVTRDGQSNYLLNNSRCRRRDVTDLFLGTGLGPRSYAIIEQGMISRLIESKPQELRVFIEEAAGISKYKERRRETENRIRHTKENLERLEDVRSELGQQLDKLQRQAAAARRFKELKAAERQLKGELAAIRWLKHSTQIEALENKLAQQQADIDAFIAKQRGDERGITTYREKQQDLKQQLDDLQRQYFTVGNDITRLEQNQLHARQRRQRIDAELDELQQRKQRAQEQIEHDDLLEQELRDRLETIRPEQELLQASLEAAQMALQEHEDMAQRNQQLWREKEQRYNDLKQRVQTCHSQIQSTMNMQMRTQQRISELEQEKNELEHDQLSAQLDTLLEHQQQVLEQQQQAQQHEQALMAQYNAANSKLDEMKRDCASDVAEQQKQHAQLAALESVQTQSAGSSLDDVLKAHNISAQPLWKLLQFVSGSEALFEVVLQHWQQSLMVSDASVIDDVNRLPEGSQLLLDWQFVTHKRDNSLATLCTNDSVPAFFNTVLLAEDEQHAVSLLDTLPDNHSVLEKNGVWRGQGWLIKGVRQQQKGQLQRATQIKQLRKSLQQLESEIEQHNQLIAQQQMVTEEAHQQWQDSHQASKHAEQAVTQIQNKVSLLQMQVEQSSSRQQRIMQELDKQRERLHIEQEQLEDVTAQVEELEMQLLEQESEQRQQHSERDAAQQQLMEKRSQVDALTEKNHQLALALQSTQAQFEAATEGARRQRQQLDEITQRQKQLREELEELTMPLEEQAQQLEIYLQQRVELEGQQSRLSDELADVEKLLNDAQKGQQSVQVQIEQMRAELEATRLESEGAKVRANAVLEQLQESGQSLKPILETLPQDSDEKDTQQRLEKTTASISRLGAVNLAAVEEYEIQSQRKQHLDEQNQDLVAAMDTLESAIRKIDKETRSRFKATYDQVNDDLKMLFPKVFGGGAAYLELTDDDLLETGVTIMARPPGKKNSTIHLLSGGEKALTALSLVFAIFRLNPAPFCLLDEVDAPLDDANVGRFCKLVSEMSKSVQFIYITHNKIAMEMASHLTGVTMAEPGVSRMVAVDVEEAVAIASA
ncbi:chromosome segregation protein SMC [Aestuariibacter salexigens]|uniref:chromosome segregation protein SMC n=1 Tax=Aestuariibacter salexigens TaxID=226010 RepID=UPI00041654A9|nr:chromosome segregation protein SMC [Aestuariibacter salexigens]